MLRGQWFLLVMVPLMTVCCVDIKAASCVTPVHVDSFLCVQLQCEVPQSGYLLLNNRFNEWPVYTQQVFPFQLSHNSTKAWNITVSQMLFFSVSTIYPQHPQYGRSTKARKQHRKCVPQWCLSHAEVHKKWRQNSCKPTYKDKLLQVHVSSTSALTYCLQIKFILQTSET